MRPCLTARRRGIVLFTVPCITRVIVRVVVQLLLISVPPFLRFNWSRHRDVIERAERMETSTHRKPETQTSPVSENDSCLSSIIITPSMVSSRWPFRAKCPTIARVCAHLQADRSPRIPREGCVKFEMPRAFTTTLR